MRQPVIVLLLCGILLLTACTSAAGPQATPTQPSPTDAPTLAPTQTPFVRRMLPPTFTPIAAAEETEVPTYIVDPLMAHSVAPPIDITLPEGWGSAYQTWGFNDTGRLTYLPFAYYEGPVTGGTGKIVLLWRFANAVAANPLRADYAEPNLYIDGLRLLRSVVFICADMSVAAQHDWYIGDVPAAGSNFDAVNCGDDVPDTKGFFIGTQIDGLNFMFFAYADPLSALDAGARAELEAIVDSVVFRPDDFRAAEAEAEVEVEAEQDNQN